MSSSFESPNAMPANDHPEAASDHDAAAPESVKSVAGSATDGQLKWLRRGLDQPGGKLPLFDDLGQKVSTRTVQSCIERGWAEPWFNNPLKPGWIVCKLTEDGRRIAAPS